MIDLNYIRVLVASGGPQSEQYEELNYWFKSIGKKAREGHVTRDQIREMWAVFGDAFSLSTMQGRVVNKPRGYAGDYETIDRIYTKWHSPKGDLVNWDKFFHWQKAAVAVRNRKEYFKEMLTKLDNLDFGNRFVLNVGSGPCRDISEFLSRSPSTHIRFECLDMDNKAVDYAKAMLNDDRVLHSCQDVFKFNSETKYDLVWSAGLFDYLDDGKFVFLFRSLLNMVAPGGEIVIGNFSESNPSRDYMEFGEWFLCHRNEEKLRSLAHASGCNHSAVTVDMDPTGVNLFVRVRKL